LPNARGGAVTDNRGVWGTALPSQGGTKKKKVGMEASCASVGVATDGRRVNEFEKGWPEQKEKKGKKMPEGTRRTGLGGWVEKR